MPDGEARRNALLRRADWRVLLPRPRPRRAVCLATGALADAVALIADAVVAPGSADGRCDLAVVADPGDGQLERCVRALAPGGGCYAEWSRPAPGGVARRRRQLERAGLTDVRLYWAWPSPRAGLPGFWLPLEAPGALAHFLATRPQPRGRAGRARQRLLAAGWRVARLSGALAPVCAVARAPGGNGEDGIWGRLRAETGPADASLVLMTGGPRSVSKLVGFAFAEPAPVPRAVVKLARTPAAARLLEREGAILAALARRADAPPGIPRALFTDRYGDVVAVGETAMPGRRLDTLVAADTYAPLAAVAADWAAKLAGRPPPVPPGAWADRLVTPVLEAFRAGFGSVAGPDALATATRLVASLPPLPLVWEHRDFSGWNLLLDDDGRLAVLDWEGAEPAGLPGFDLLYFLANHAFHLDGAFATGRYGESYRRSLDPATPTGRVAAAALRRYGERVGVPDSAWPGLRVLHWMLKARSEHGRLVEDAGGDPAPAALRQSVFLALWHEELRRLDLH